MGYRSDGTVYIDTRIDSKGFGKGVNTMQKQVSGLNSAINKLGAVIATTFAIGKIVQFGKEAIELGSDLQEVQNVVDVTFETMNKQVNEFAKGAAEAAGLSETMAKKYVGTFGAMAKAFGFAENESFDMATALTQLAGDVASFYNITQDEAYTKLKSVFTGETESLKDLGVVMTQSALDSFALAKGYGKTTAAMEENEKVALRYAFVVDKLNAASGDFERTSGGWANQMRILSLNFDTFKANVGQALINVFTPLLRVINTLVSRLANMSQYFVAFSELIVGKQTSSGGGSSGESLEEVADGYESIAAAAEDATKAQKGYISNLDELNNYTSGSGANSSLEDDLLGDLNGVTDSILQDIKDSAGLVEELEQKFPRLVKILQTIADKVKEIAGDFAMGDYFEAGKDISELATIIFDSISEAIGEVDWDELGTKAGEFIKGIEWKEILKNALWMKVNLWSVIAEAWVGAFSAAPLETAIITAIAALNWTGLGSAILSGMWKALKAGVKKLLPKLLPFLSMCLSSMSPGMIGELGLWLEEILRGTFLDTSTWTGVAKDVDEAIEAFIDSIGEGFKLALSRVFNFDTSMAIFGDAGAFFSRIKEDFDRQDWLGIGEDIVAGIGAGIAGALYFLIEPIADLFQWTWEELCETFGIHSPSEEMKPIGEYILLGIVEGFLAAFGCFDEAVEEFWDEKVSPWFTKEKWEEGMAGIKEAWTATWTNAVNAAIAIFNKFIDYVNDKMNIQWPAVPWLGIEEGNMQLFTIPKIPMLAKGAVIPPNAPFMAMLGDQRNGNNIEAPEDLIRKIVREESGTDAETKALLSEIAQNTRETADKDLTIGDREIARANARGQRSMGYTLVTEG